MKKFADFGINPLKDRKIFAVPTISIEQTIGEEIEVLDFEPNVITQHGEGRHIVHIRMKGIEYKFFATSQSVKAALDAIQKSDFPFVTTIRQQWLGKGKMFYFT